VQTTRFLAVAMTTGCIEVFIDPIRTDVIVQTQTPKVDILWMVDNSCSMADDQTRLTDNFPFFMDYFVDSGLDYHVGVTSSDTIRVSENGADGKLVVKRGLKYLDVDTPDPVVIFQEMATLGAGGASPERGLASSFFCLEEKRETFNAGFYRDDASLHTIIISDEADYTQAFVITQPEYSDWYGALKDDRENRTFSGIISPSQGARYRQTINDVGGIEDSVLNDNWSQVLERLGVQAAGLKREYFLSGVPVPGTIEVSVELAGDGVLDFQEDEEWTYSETRNSVTFVEFVPEALSQVVLTYTALASLQSSNEVLE
jgi:hypothetical protein